MFNRKKNANNKLEKSFGKVKDESFVFELIDKYFRDKNNQNEFHVLSDRICNDLDFSELFMFLDRTNSKIGQQYLYNKLRIFPKLNNTINEGLITLLMQDAELRISIQKQLQELNKHEAFYIQHLFQNEHIHPPRWFVLVQVLPLISILSVLLILVKPQMIVLLLGLFIINIVIHLWNKRNLFQYTESIPQLLRMIKVATKLFTNDRLKQIKPNLSNSLEPMLSVRARSGFFSMEAKIENEFTALIWGLIELLKILFLLEPLFLFGILKQLDSKRKEIEEIYSFIGEIDCLLSIASLRYGLPKYCQPSVVEEEKILQTVEVYHPLVDDCVENTIDVDKNSVLLTGSNMSGKTTFIRTIGVNVITGFTLNTCFAEKFRLPKIRLFSAIRISDDLMNDKSYYFEEVLTVKSMLDRSEEKVPTLFLLDEIYKGTNTIERISAGKAVLSSLNKGNNIVFVSTHDIELADLLKEEYDLYHFNEKVEDDTIDFDYKLKQGKLKNRNAIKILELSNYPAAVVNEAVSISQLLDEKR